MPARVNGRGPVAPHGITPTPEQQSSKQQDIQEIAKKAIAQQERGYFSNLAKYLTSEVRRFGHAFVDPEYIAIKADIESGNPKRIENRVKAILKRGDEDLFKYCLSIMPDQGLKFLIKDADTIHFRWVSEAVRKKQEWAVYCNLKDLFGTSETLKPDRLKAIAEAFPQIYKSMNLSPLKELMRNKNLSPTLLHNFFASIPSTERKEVEQCLLLGSHHSPLMNFLLSKHDTSVVQALFEECSSFESRDLIYSGTFGTVSDIDRTIFDCTLNNPMTFDLVYKNTPPEYNLEKIGFIKTDSIKDRLKYIASKHEDIKKLTEKLPEYRDVFSNFIYHEFDKVYKELDSGTYLQGHINQDVLMLFYTLLQMGAISEDKFISLCKTYPEQERIHFFEPFEYQAKGKDHKTVYDPLLALTDETKCGCSFWEKLIPVVPGLSQLKVHLHCADGTDDSWTFEDLYLFSQYKKTANWKVDLTFSDFSKATLDQVIKPMLHPDNKQEETTAVFLYKTFDRWAKESGDWDDQLKLENLERQVAMTPRILLKILNMGITREQLFAQSRAIAFRELQKEGPSMRTPLSWGLAKKTPLTQALKTLRTPFGSPSEITYFSGPEQKILMVGSEYFKNLWKSDRFKESNPAVVTVIEDLAFEDVNQLIDVISTPSFSFPDIETAIRGFLTGDGLLAPALKKHAIDYLSKMLLKKTDWISFLATLSEGGLDQHSLLWNTLISSLIENSSSSYPVMSLYAAAKELNLPTLQKEAIENLITREDFKQAVLSTVLNPHKFPNFVLAIKEAGIDRNPIFHRLKAEGITS